MEWSVLDELTQKGNSTGGCDVVAGAQRAEGRPWGGARESQSTEKVKGVTGNGKCWSGKNVKKASDQVLARIYCNDQCRWDKVGDWTRIQYVMGPSVDGEVRSTVQH